MLALKTKQSGGKLLPHSDFRGGGVFLGETFRNIQREMGLAQDIDRLRTLVSAVMNLRVP